MAWNLFWVCFDHFYFFQWIIICLQRTSNWHNNWSAMSSTNPRCSLQIRGVIYQSAGVNYWSEEKIKMLETYPKKVPSQKTFLLVHLGTMTFHKLRFQFWTPRLKKALFMLFLLVINIIGRGSKNLFKVAIPGEKIKRQCFGISRGDNQGSALIPKIYFSVLSFGYLTFNLLYAV